MADTITVRIATEADAEALLAIYEGYVRNTAITFEYEVPSVEEFRNTARLDFKCFYDIRQYDKNMDGCYVTIEKID